MKKLFITTIILLSANIIWGQVLKNTKDNPTVDISIEEVTATEVTVHFNPNADCAKYYTMIDTVGGLEYWANTFGQTVENLVVSWGIMFSTQTTHTFPPLTPNTDYVIYVRPFDNAETGYDLITDTVHTTSMGGTGVATIELEVAEITETSVRLLASPNDQTSVYHDGLVTEELFNEVGVDSVVEIMLSNHYPLYDDDDHVWLSLSQGTKYKAIGIGKNTNGELGEVAILDFTTLGDPIFNKDIQSNSKIKIYPQPNNGHFVIENKEMNENNKIYIFDMNGICVYKEIFEDNKKNIDVSHLPEGHYLLKTQNNKQAIKFVIEK